MPIPVPLPLCSQFIQNKSYLETVKEEESSSNLDTEVNDLAIDGREIQTMSEEELLNSVENQLYEQLSQFKPLKTKSFKTSASICLANSESNEQIEKLNVSTSIIITPNNQINDGKNDSQCLILNGKNSKQAVRFSEPGAIKSVKSKIITNGSMYRSSLNKNENNDFDKNNADSMNECLYATKKYDDQLNCEEVKKKSILSTVLVQKRNMENMKNGISSMGSSTSSIASCSSTPRRVSLSVTDL